MLEIRVGNKYRLGKKIGSGSFGEIFLGINVQTNQEVAIKLENLNDKHPKLSYESKILKLLQDGEGVPFMYWYGTEESYNVLVMELLGPSIEDLFSYCNRKFSIKTVVMIADQILNRVEIMHNKNYIHRDIKPDNFLIGLGNRSDSVYMIDFGLAKKYRDPMTLQHIPEKTGKSLAGTARYASISTHLGIEQSRRDDLESLSYLMIYLILGSLPWQGIPASNKEEKYQRILDKKRGFSLETCFSALPEEVIGFYNYCISLKFTENPDYAYLRGLLKDLMCRENLQFDHIFDWTIKNYSTHKHLRSNLMDDLRINTALNETNQVMDESRVVNSKIPRSSMNNAAETKGKKCITF